MTNDYKKDGDKPPVLAALMPFYPALEALARLMVDSAEKHKLQGAEDSFSQWRQLPNAQERLANAGTRHNLKGPWTIDPDSGHCHQVHNLFNVLASLTLYEEGKEKPLDPPDCPGCGTWPCSCEERYVGGLMDSED